MVRELKKKIIMNSESENENGNTLDNFDYEIKEIDAEEQNIGEKKKQQNEIKNRKKSKKEHLNFRLSK